MASWMTTGMSSHVAGYLRCRQHRRSSGSNAAAATRRHANHKAALVQQQHQKHTPNWITVLCSLESRDDRRVVLDVRENRVRQAGGVDADGSRGA